MNNDSIIRQISDLTKNWTLEDWIVFRSRNDYWAVKDKMNRFWYHKKSGKWNNYAYSNWLNWKLLTIKEDSY